MTAPRRRWFAFSLRTLFVVVAVFGCWLGWQLNWIRQRHEFVASLNPDYHFFRMEDENGDPVRAPFPLFLFGEPGYSFVTPKDESEQGVGRKLFPEARVDFVPPPSYPESWEPYD